MERAAEPQRPALLFALLAVLLMPAAAGCRSTQQAEADPETGPAQTTESVRVSEPVRVSLAEAADRSVRLATTGCGYAPPTEGSGVALDDHLILTAAHVVSDAGSIVVTKADSGRGNNDGNPETTDPGRAARVVAYDPLRDLALVALINADSPIGSDADTPANAEPDRAPIPDANRSAWPELGLLDEGGSGTIVAAATSGDVRFEITDKTIIEIDEVRGTRRSQRAGYVLRAVTRPGDSGSGLYDDRGQLVGLLFAVSTGDQGRSWATSADEIEAFLGDETLTGRFACDPDRSRLTSVD